MKKSFFALLSTIFILTTLGFQSFASAEGREENSLQQYAKKHAISDVLDTVRSEDHEDFNFSSSEKIRIGEFYQSWGYNQEFIDKKSTNLEKTGEWYAVIYQDERPVNVLAASKNEEGNYSFMAIGFGEDLAIALDQKGSHGGKLIYEFPTDAWFIFDQGRVYAVNQSAKSLIGNEKIKFSEYRDFVHDRYKNPEEIIEYGANTATGGSKPFTPLTDSVKGKSLNFNFLYIGSSLFVLLAFIIFIRRKKFKKIIN